MTAPAHAQTLAQRQKTLKDLFAKAQGSVEAVVPRHLNAEKLLKVALLAANKTPLLYQCDPKTVLSAVMQASQLGLEINSPLGHAYLIPFKNRSKGTVECQLIPGYRGYIDLARRSGRISTIYADVIFEGEPFEYEKGSSPRLTHRPDLDRDENNADAVIAAYAVALFDGRYPQFELMGRKALDRIWKGSRSANDGPWVTHRVEQYKKTVLRRLCKYLPLSSELAAAIELDNRADSGEVSGVSEFIDLDPVTGDVPEPAASGNGEQKPLATEALKEKVAKKREEVAREKAEAGPPPPEVTAQSQEDLEFDQRLADEGQ